MRQPGLFGSLEIGSREARAGRDTPVQATDATEWPLESQRGRCRGR
jgi:hypothetical protein